MSSAATTPHLAVVTGAGRGIGREIAFALAAVGHHVVICARTHSELAATTDTIRGQGGRVTAVPADVASEQDLGRLVAIVREHGEPVDVLVNNAAISPKPRDGRGTPVLEMTVQEWNEVLTTNLTSAFILSRDIGALMCERSRGSIVNISSISARIGGQTSAAHYVASKAGLLGLTKATARELAPFGVRVNAVAPGRISTTLTASGSRVLPPEWIREVPLGREGLAREVADLVAFLASDRASYITGATIDVNGGWFMN